MSFDFSLLSPISYTKTGVGGKDKTFKYKRYKPSSSKVFIKEKVCKKLENCKYCSDSLISHRLFHKMGAPRSRQIHLRHIRY